MMIKRRKYSQFFCDAPARLIVNIEIFFLRKYISDQNKEELLYRNNASAHQLNELISSGSIVAMWNRILCQCFLMHGVNTMSKEEKKNLKKNWYWLIITYQQTYTTIKFNLIGGPFVFINIYICINTFLSLFFSSVDITPELFHSCNWNLPRIHFLHRPVFLFV